MKKKRTEAQKAAEKHLIHKKKGEKNSLEHRRKISEGLAQKHARVNLQDRIQATLLGMKSSSGKDGVDMLINELVKISAGKDKEEKYLENTTNRLKAIDKLMEFGFEKPKVITEEQGQNGIEKVVLEYVSSNTPRMQRKETNKLEQKEDEEEIS